MKYKILIIEDEPHIVGILEYLMFDEGYDVSIAYTGEDGLALLEKETIHLIILDLNLPGMNGLEVCNRIKQRWSIPVVILSSRDKDSDVVSGLEIGAEDYIKKPFNHREVILRIRKILNRISRIEQKKDIHIGGLHIHTDRKFVSHDDIPINLTPTEYSLLSYLASRPGWVVSWQVICKEVWGHQDWEGGRELVKVSIQRLRKKIEPDPSQPIYILNEWGRGYKISSPSDHRAPSGEDKM